ncbi:MULTISPECIES: TetR/AcrR family transcriptional regulator [Corallincola]|uniref:TetR/AcrR family transcriptional regulator n=3 Tax=Corallincola TaxID=1775176 RepID=A0A368NLT1_9GAMM|nr:MULTISPECIES: TetR/AcrR family transcriptional regulator [Corallincola]RCU50594.1 TetR/AcrR family transcriptional regulator [Corallincola holothuriorum]TAA48477.1 TetR/AcrR family transcriptional regulator [Corallincola spongiicola]TCI01840.1 TetR/AcrR family transcriptional regulator [Corallincola luteus]
MRLDTKTRILDEAELLFAERGFSDTSLRLITTRAEVNLASVNYHFGSKKALIRAVLERYLQTFMPALDEALSNLLKQQRRPEMTEVFEAFVEPLLLLNGIREKGTTLFMQLLGRGYSDTQGHLRWYLIANHGAVIERISEAVRAAYPELSASDLFWRLHFTLGTVIFTMASQQALSEISDADFNQSVDIEDVIRRVIPYIAAGVSAPIPTNLRNEDNHVTFLKV